MNKYRFQIVAIIFILLISNVFFAMNEVLHDKMFNFEKLLPEFQLIIINRLDNPLIFGKTCKAMHALVRQEGKHNLEKLYKNQEPTFVYDFLLSHYVPIILINDSLIVDNKIMYFFSVDAYEISFYAEPKKQIFDKEIIACGEKRFKYEWQQKIEQYKPLTIAHVYSRGGSFMKAILFGSDEDIESELNKSELNSSINSYNNFVMEGVFKAAISYSNNKNNALAILLEYLKKIKKNKMIKSDISLRNLLYLAQKVGNRKAEDILCIFLQKNGLS